jgi:hypothetical protein
MKKMKTPFHSPIHLGTMPSTTVLSDTAIGEHAQRVCRIAVLGDMPLVGEMLTRRACFQSLDAASCELFCAARLFLKREAASCELCCRKGVYTRTAHARAIRTRVMYCCWRL